MGYDTVIQGVQFEYLIDEYTLKIIFGRQVVKIMRMVYDN